MNSNNIYSILSTKNHNAHFLNRYISLIVSYKDSKEGESHHICPKANDMFPEYKSLVENPWNKILLPVRVHRLAHLILAKAYPDVLSQSYSAVKFFKKGTSSKLYESYVNKKNHLHSLRMSGENNPFFGKSHTEESKSKMGWAAYDEQTRKERLSNKIIPEKSRMKMYECGKNNYHHMHTEEATIKRTESMRDFYSDPNKRVSRIEKYRVTFNSREDITCPRCGMVSKHRGNMNRYHFDNCKSLREEPF